MRLEEPPYSDECWANTMACTYEDNNIIIAVNSGLPARAPDVVEMLRRWGFDIDASNRAALRWQYETREFGSNATALWWLQNHSHIWTELGSRPKRRKKSRQRWTPVRRP